MVAVGLDAARGGCKGGLDECVLTGVMTWCILARMIEIALRTRQHRSGNSLSVRLPGVAAYPDSNQELEVIVRGDERVIRPVKPEPAQASRPTSARSWDEFFRWLDEHGPVELGPEALIRAEMPDKPWYRRD